MAVVDSMGRTYRLSRNNVVRGTGLRIGYIIDLPIWLRIAGHRQGVSHVVPCTHTPVPNSGYANRFKEFLGDSQNRWMKFGVVIDKAGREVYAGLDIFRQGRRAWHHSTWDVQYHSGSTSETVPKRCLANKLDR